MITAAAATERTQKFLNEEYNKLLAKEAKETARIEGEIIGKADTGANFFYTDITDDLPPESVGRITKTLKEAGFTINMTGAYCFSISWPRKEVR